ncbi:uncharacterized protein EAF02_002286 [Botrytis sinoallii]|uniref:uncharacterized protein n=1 Tax=Botrytis sinoallii TaxID=1463999 RepID=UPI0019027F00|nr:uncharacterized protein EAF02_002286 [Botrytis sinoallii]KAF7889871.1 hypothetical protein EAF02_002286 [Botrytis sinoallii]
MPSSPSPSPHTSEGATIENLGRNSLLEGDNLETSDTTSPYLQGWRLAVVITSLTLGIFLIALDTTIIGVAIPKITSDFRNLDDIAWFGSAYLLTVTAFQPSFGTLYKFFNAKYVYLISILIFEVGSILCAAALNSSMFILGRAISGLGAAGLYQGALGIVGYTVVLEKRPLYFGIVVSSFAISGCIGPIIGGVLTDHVSWRWCFWINVPIGAVVLVVVTIFLNLKSSNIENAALPLKSKMKYVDGAGTLTFIGAITSLLLALQWGGQSLPWSSPKIIGLLVAFGGLAFIFAIIQWKRGECAIIPLRVVCQRSVSMVICLLFFVGLTITVLSYYIPIYFQAVRGLSATASGIRFISMIVPQTVCLIVVGAFASIWGYYAPYIIAGTTICTVGCGLLTTIGLGTTTVQWAAFIAIIGIGFGGALQLPYTALQLVLSENDLPTGNAIAVFSSQLGGAVGLAIGQVLLLTNLQTNIPRLAPSISPDAVIQAGASNLNLLTADPEVLISIRGAWSSAVHAVFVLALVASALSVPFSFGIEHLNVHVVAKKRKEAQ